MKFIASFFNWIIFIIVALRYVLGGFFYIPFGTAGAYYRRISPSFGRYMLKAVGAKASYIGLENIDPSKSYIFAGNHQSYVDIFLVQASLGAAGVHVLFMAKRDLFKIPLFGTAIRHMGLIPIEKEESRDGLKTMLDSVKTLKEGHSLTVFAEGSRTKDGRLQPFKKGAFLLSSKTGLEIVPFVIRGTMQIMSANDMHINRGKECSITFLPAITPEKRSAKELAEITEDVITAEYNKDA